LGSAPGPDYVIRFLKGIEIVVLAFILVLTKNRETNGGELLPVLLGSKGARFQSRHRIVPNQWFRRRGKQQAATRHDYVGDPRDQASLIFGTKQKHESPCQDAIESSIKKSRILNGFANHGCVWEIALECLDEGWCCINAKDMKAFGDQNLGDGETGPAP
jgi:hypothetical protein